MDGIPSHPPLSCESYRTAAVLTTDRKRSRIRETAFGTRSMRAAAPRSPRRRAGQHFVIAALGRFLNHGPKPRRDKTEARSVIVPLNYLTLITSGLTFTGSYGYGLMICTQLELLEVANWPDRGRALCNQTNAAPSEFQVSCFHQSTCERKTWATNTAL